MSDKQIRIVFISNFFNHHQLGLCDELSSLTLDNFYFIYTSGVPLERIKLGYGETIPRSYLVNYYLDEDRALKIINDSDAIIAGDCDDKLLMYARKQDKLILKYSEHHFKKKYLPLLGFLKREYVGHKKRAIKYSANEYLLCASSFVASEYKKMRLPYQGYLKFGYFSAIAYQNEQNALFKDDTIHLLWCGRFLNWEHPDYALKILNYLVKKGANVDLSIAGSGDETIKKKLTKYAIKHSLLDRVHFLGSLNYQMMDSVYKQNDIYLFTSDQNEGWGAVLNEAMSHGLVVFASQKAGSTRYLNCCNNLFAFKNLKELKQQSLLICLNNKDYLIEKGILNRQVINDLWNYKVAAKRLFLFCERFLVHHNVSYFDDGPLSEE